MDELEESLAGFRGAEKMDLGGTWDEDQNNVKKSKSG